MMVVEEVRGEAGGHRRLAQQASISRCSSAPADALSLPDRSY